MFRGTDMKPFEKKHYQYSNYDTKYYIDLTSYSGRQQSNHGETSQ